MSEDEDILKDIDWVEQTPDEILHQLQSQAKDLNLSIVDFLLKWEIANEKSSSPDDHSKPKTPSKNNLNENISISTFELIDKGVNALTKVESDLLQVDKWIENQVIQLEETKTKLSLIELESAMYETNFKNLSNIEEIIEFLLAHMSLSQDEETVLNDPQPIFEEILELNDPVKNAKKYLRSLIEISIKFKNALSFDGKTINFSFDASNHNKDDIQNSSTSITATLFEQLQSLPILTLQKEYLYNIGANFCKQLIKQLPEFYNDLFQHDSFSEYLSQNNNQIKTIKFNFFEIELECIRYHKVKRDFSTIFQLNDIPGNSEKGGRHGMDMPSMFSVVKALAANNKNSTFLTSFESILLKSYHLSEDIAKLTENIQNKGSNEMSNIHNTVVTETNLSTDIIESMNEGLIKQCVLHNLFIPFLPLYELYFDFQRTSFFPFLQHLYIGIAESRFYSPMFRSLLKDVKSCIMLPKPSAMCTLLSIFNFNVSGKRMNLPITLHATTQKNKWLTREYSINVSSVANSNSFICSPWVGFGLVLAIITPILQYEEKFLQNAWKVSNTEPVLPRKLKKSRRPSGTGSHSVDRGVISHLGDDSDVDSDEEGGTAGADDGHDVEKSDDDDDDEYDKYRNSYSVMDRGKMTTNDSKIDVSTSLSQSAVLASTGNKVNTVLKLDVMMTEIFQYIRNGEKILKSILQSNTSTLSTTSHHTEHDGIVCIALLAVLQPYIVTNLSSSVSDDIINPILKTATTCNDGYHNLSQTRLSDTSVVQPPPSHINRSESLMRSLQFTRSVDTNPMSPTAGLITNTATQASNDYNSIFSDNASTRTVVGYIPNLLLNMQRQLIDSIYKYFTEQITWIQQQKGDPKGGISLIAYRLPSLIYQIFSLIGEQKISCIDQMIERLIQASFDWIHNFSLNNYKYCDVIRIQNYSFLKEAFDLINNNNSPLFKSFIELSESVLLLAETSYVTWMVEYEFQSIAKLAKRLHSISAGFNDEDIALYVKRKDVLDLRKEIEGKKFIDGVNSIKSRLQKHFEGHDLDLTPALWQRILQHIETTVHRVDIASKYFQIKSKTHNNNNHEDNHDKNDAIFVALNYLRSVEI